MLFHERDPDAHTFRGAAGGRGPGQSPALHAAINPRICLKGQQGEGNAICNLKQTSAKR